MYRFTCISGLLMSATLLREANQKIIIDFGETHLCHTFRAYVERYNQES